MGTVIAGASGPIEGAASSGGAGAGSGSGAVQQAEGGGAGDESHGFEYDLVVIGGGSGGLACSKEAAKLGKKVACLDFVKPTPLGTQWGLGGTCVNVGCIPKKLFHQASIIGESFSDARAFGWGLTDSRPALDWSKLVMGIQDYIGSLNWGYRVQLRDSSVKYLNALGKFVGPNTLRCTDRRGQITTVTSSKFLVAVGGRPKYPGVPGDRELCITSDDVFSLASPPGKTLCVGASYISLETAGFLAGLGFPTAVMARSIFLRGFDQEIAEHIVGHMSRHGVRVIRPATPVKFERNPAADKGTVDAATGVGTPGKILVTFRMVDTGEEHQEDFDTVVLAVGRAPETADLGLEAVGVQLDPESKKIIGVQGEQTSAPHIFAVGDVLQGSQELTPVAIKAGTLLARRLFGGSTVKMDYNLVATTVFTPLEYGCIGMSEEDAIKALGEENVEAYISYFKPLEWQTNHEEHDGVLHREDNSCYVKLLTNKLKGERVVGLHVVAPNAGEITQGYAVSMKMGATKADFDATVGIHPTLSEEFTILRITRRSGESPYKTGC